VCPTDQIYFLLTAYRISERDELSVFFGRNVKAVVETASCPADFFLSVLVDNSKFDINAEGFCLHALPFFVPAGQWPHPERLAIAGRDKNSAVVRVVAGDGNVADSAPFGTVVFLDKPRVADGDDTANGHGVEFGGYGATDSFSLSLGLVIGIAEVCVGDASHNGGNTDNEIHCNKDGIRDGLFHGFSLLFVLLYPP